MALTLCFKLTVFYINIVGNSNFSNISWYPIQHFGACAKCRGLSDNELKFVNILRKNSLLQHVVEPTRQRGSDTPHTLDLVITSDNLVSDIDHLSPLGMSDHCVLKFYKPSPNQTGQDIG